MGDALSVFDALMTASVLLAGVVGAYWSIRSAVNSLGVRIDAEAKTIVRIETTLTKHADELEKLRRRDDFRRGRESAEKSGVEDIPRRRAHDATDTFSG